MLPTHSPIVLPGLVPGIHVFPRRQDVDGRDKNGHGGWGGVEKRVESRKWNSRMRVHRIFAAALAAAVAAAAPPARAADTAQQSAAASPATKVNAAQVDEGRRIYAQHCSHCHGFNMVSAGNVTFDLREFPRTEKDRFLESVVNGKDNRMPPWGDVLSLDEIEAIWAYVLTRGK
jgi:cytochrome c55X